MKRYSSSASISPMMASGLLMVKTAQLPTSRVLQLEWAFDGRTCEGQPCQGLWRIIAYYPGSTFFAPSQDNISHEIQWREPVSASADAGFFTPANTMALVILLMALIIGGVRILSTHTSTSTGAGSAWYPDRCNVTTRGEQRIYCCNL